MIQIRIEDETKALQHLKKQLSEKQLKKVTAWSINRGIASANTIYRRAVSAHYNIKQMDVGKAITAKRATQSKPVGTISARRNPLSLSRFNPSFTDGDTVITIKSIKSKETGKRALERKSKKANRNTRGLKGVSFQIRKGHTERLPYAFMTRSANDVNVGVEKQIFGRGTYIGGKFELKKPRFPIQALKTASPFGFMTKHEVSEAVSKGASASMHREFKRLIQEMIKK
ncbi:MAG: hypothetical protein ABS44_11785 [Chryseobacterium sp. SCN 40-13]|nr:MAG: hypothetical protein ABS44_11785 [Chryseobacterium sp. SCN 40-13]